MPVELRFSIFAAAMCFFVETKKHQTSAREPMLKMSDAFCCSKMHIHHLPKSFDFAMPVEI